MVTTKICIIAYDDIMTSLVVVHINILVTCCNLTVGGQLAKTKVREKLDYIVDTKRWETGMR